MRTTSKCWLVANFEIITAVTLTVLIIPFFVIVVAVNDVQSDFRGYFFIFFSLIIIPYILASTPPKLTKSIIVYLLILGCNIGLFFPKDENGEFFIKLWFLIFLLVMFLGASIVAFLIARYAKENFDEMVSRRMLYRNSSVSMFEEEWKYALDRFCLVTFCLLDTTVVILFAVRFVLGIPTPLDIK